MKKLLTFAVVTAVLSGACSTQEPLSEYIDGDLTENIKEVGSKSEAQPTDLKGELDANFVEQIVKGSKDVAFCHNGVNLYHNYMQDPGMYAEAENHNPDLPNRCSHNLFSDTIIFKGGKALYQPVKLASGLGRSPIQAIWNYYILDTESPVKLYSIFDYDINIDGRFIKFQDCSFIDVFKQEGMVSEFNPEGLALGFKIDRGGWSFCQVEKYNAVKIEDIDMSDAIVFDSVKDLCEYVTKTARAHFGRYINCNQVINKDCLDHPIIILDDPIIDIDTADEWIKTNL